ncbi:MAG: aa3-type cytochrome c oxidase subunit IV [Pseudomonadota bacterium]
MTEHKHGEMDTTEQVRTFNTSMVWIVRASIAVIILLILLALINA